MRTLLARKLETDVECLRITSCFGQIQGLHQLHYIVTFMHKQMTYIGNKWVGMYCI